MKALRSFAANGRVPLFAVVGAGACDAVDELLTSPWVARAVSPRHAGILLLAGGFRDADLVAIQRVHDQMSHPRATVVWGASDIVPWDGIIALEADDDPLPTLRDVYRRLLAGTLPSENPLLPDEPPVLWRGVGEHGQGGKGMMGGTPYGRPMAMTGDDVRDGLALDRYTVQVGPFLPGLPSGLVLEVTLQGDVIQEARVVRPPYAKLDRWGAGADETLPRLAGNLRSVARVLALLELRPQSERLLRLAASHERGEARALESWFKGFHRASVLRSIPIDLGRIDTTLASSLGGIAPTARERVAAWFDQAESFTKEPGAGRSLPVARAALPSELAAPSPDAFTDLLVGLEWTEALIVIASFDTEMLCRMSPSPDPPTGGGASPAPALHAMHHAAHSS